MNQDSRSAIFVPGQEFVSKPYGYEDIICNTDLYCGKIIYLHKGHYNHWHYHKKKDEVFRCWSGFVRVFYSIKDCKDGGILNYSHPDMSFLDLRQGESMRIPPGLRHQFWAIENSFLIEISTHSDKLDSIYV